VVATTTGSAASRFGEGSINLRLGMFLESATALGGLVGAVISVTLLATRPDVLTFVLIPVIGLSAVLMAVGRQREANRLRPPDRLAKRLGLGGKFEDPVTHETEEYAVTRTGLGLLLSSIAGLASGLLGIGGGIFKMPAMNALMNVPFRVARATSTLMIGVTAASGALVYLFVGDVTLFLAGPVVLSVFAGSFVAIEFEPRWSVRRLRFLFVGILVLAAVSLLLRALGRFP
ncbi:MAG TPA: sulfite exporter TauE/SafE family protein, partial [Thermoplasmata archaeon]|nr:sulfite exporter TauE/SafE family protein [Thermoplasmata archaeon]